MDGTSLAPGGTGGWVCINNNAANFAAVCLELKWRRAGDEQCESYRDRRCYIGRAEY